MAALEAGDEVDVHIRGVLVPDTVRVVRGVTLKPCDRQRYLPALLRYDCTFDMIYELPSSLIGMEIMDIVPIVKVTKVPSQHCDGRVNDCITIPSNDRKSSPVASSRHSLPTSPLDRRHRQAADDGAKSSVRWADLLHRNEAASPSRC